MAKKIIPLLFVLMLAFLMRSECYCARPTPALTHPITDNSVDTVPGRRAASNFGQEFLERSEAKFNPSPAVMVNLYCLSAVAATEPIRVGFSATDINNHDKTRKLLLAKIAKIVNVWQRILMQIEQSEVVI